MRTNERVRIKKRDMKVIRQIVESLIFALHSASVNKLRTFLSLLGITIGIFAIISVLTVIDSLERNVKNSLQSLGNNVVYVQKWPWQIGGEYTWWKYMNRPQPSFKEYEAIEEKANGAEAFAFLFYSRLKPNYKSATAEESSVLCATYNYNKIRSFDILKGRYFSVLETNQGKPLAIIGLDVAQKLFGKEEPLGKVIKIGRNKVTVIGVFKREGKTMLGDESVDQVVLVPAHYGRRFVDLRRAGPTIMVKAAPNVPTDEVLDEIRSILRAERRLKPLEEDNFALNQISQLSQGIDNIFGVLNIAGVIIGGFSILVGGFGIANIMFVSVKERTNMIGVQKALGAKQYVILLQFLYESVLLSIMGGGIGLLLVFLGAIGISSPEFEIALSFQNIVTGLSISAAIGIISGFIPAYTAAKLDPVEAINAKV